MYVHERSLLQHQTMDLSHGMDATQLGWLSRNWIRLRHEVVRRLHAIDAGPVYGRHRLSSVFLLSLALRTLPVGTGYAVWTGIGAAGTAILGIAVLGDSAAPMRMLCIALILAGVIGLKLVSG